MTAEPDTVTHPEARKPSRRARADVDAERSILSDDDAGFTIADLLGLPKVEQPPDPDEVDETGVKPISIYAFREDAVFASSNEWGFPDLRTDRLSDIVPNAVWPRAGQPSPTEKAVFLYDTVRVEPPPFAEGHVLGFYLHDSRFEQVWTDAVRVIERLHAFPWGAVIMPDFSRMTLGPMIVGAFNLYRSIWCARYWQEVGINVIPNLALGDRRLHDIVMATTPPTAPVLSMECRTGTTNGVVLRNTIEGLERIIAAHTVRPTISIYGAEYQKRLEGKLPDGADYVWVPSLIYQRTRLGLTKRQK